METLFLGGGREWLTPGITACFAATALVKLTQMRMGGDEEAGG